MIVVVSAPWPPPRWARAPLPSSNAESLSGQRDTRRFDQQSCVKILPFSNRSAIPSHAQNQTQNGATASVGSSCRSNTSRRLLQFRRPTLGRPERRRHTVTVRQSRQPSANSRSTATRHEPVEPACQWRRPPDSSATGQAIGAQMTSIRVLKYARPSCARM